MTRRTLSVLFCLVTAATARPAWTAAQGIDALLAGCASLSSGPPDACIEGAVTARAVLAQAGLLAGFGSEIAGSTSTLGRRLGTSPRISGSFRFGGLQSRIPHFLDRGNGPSGEASFFIPAVHGSLAFGVFDGFRLMPTVGGFLSVDLLAQAALSFLPKEQGFGGSVTSVSFGARIGIIRESFTLPGVTLSVSRRTSRPILLGDASAGDPTSIRIDPSVTSLRATVGKDLFAWGLLVGMGWDDYDTDATLRFSDPGSPVVSVSAPLQADRLLFFAGSSITFLVLQFSGEVGWARGLSPVPGYLGAPFEPTRRSIFASLAARLTL